MIRPIVRSMVRPIVRGVLGDSFAGYLNLLWTTGQSLSVATGSSATVTTDPLPSTYLFNGVSATGNLDTPIDPSDLLTSRAFVETGSQSHNYTQLERLKVGSSDSWLGASHGKGSSSVLELSPPSVMYDNGEDMGQAALTIATELGLSLRIPFLTFIQGESGSNSLTELRSLQDLYIAQATAVTGQAELPMIIDQTGAYYGRANAIARLEYASQNSDAFLAFSKYPLNRLYPSNPTSDWIHLNGDGYMLQGDYFGIAGRAVMDTGEFKTFQPESFEVVGNTIEITCHVPVSPIRFTTEHLPQCPAEGFLYESIYSGFIVPTVTAVGNKIILDIGQIPQYRDVISFGDSLDDSGTHPSGEKLPCGNIFDSQSIPTRVAGYNLPNPLVLFDHEMQKSEGTDPELWRFGDPITGLGLGTGTLIAGENFDINAQFKTGDIVRIQFKHNGTGSFRNRTSIQSTPFTGNGTEQVENFTITADEAFQRNLFQEFTGGYVGDIYDISVINEGA